MKSNFRQYRFLMVVTFSLWISSLPTVADTVSEALPMPQRQSASQETKPKENKDAAVGTMADEGGSFDEGPNDPLEPLNRLIFGINDLFDFVILRPVAEIYRAITPEPLRNGVTNVLDNLFSPVVFLNHILQGEPERATATLFRFITNSTFGLFGLVDVTSDLGYPRYNTDFNQTLTAWGVDTGPYLVLPLIGPSSFRGGRWICGRLFCRPA